MGFVRKVNSLAVMGRSSHAKRIEPDGPEFLEAQPEILQHLINAGWDHCIFLFQGHDVEITSQFILSYSNDYATVKGFSFRVSEASIAEAIRVSMDGENGLKRTPLKASISISF